MHSQSMKIPDCPTGWEELWTGYSYFMVKFDIDFYKFSCFSFFFCLQHTTDNTGGYGQDLISPGSCLEEFRQTPIIECHGHGRCNFYDTLTAFWLTVIEDGDMFRRPVPLTLKRDHSSKISR